MQDGLYIRIGEPVGSFRASDVGNYTQGRLGGLLNMLCNSNTFSSGFYRDLIDETSTLMSHCLKRFLGTSSMIYLFVKAVLEWVFPDVFSSFNSRMATVTAIFLYGMCSATLSYKISADSIFLIQWWIRGVLLGNALGLRLRQRLL